MMLSFQGSPDAPGERREETAVINLTEMSSRYTDYAARVERVNFEGWMWETSVPTGGSRRREMPTVFALMRRHLGESLVRAGERLQGTPAGQIVDAATV
jgi:hypothetical protein